MVLKIPKHLIDFTKNVNKEKKNRLSSNRQYSNKNSNRTHLSQTEN